jgi:hypothetical protein
MMISRVSPVAPVCDQCGQPIKDVHKGVGAVIVLYGQIIGDEMYVHQGACNHQFVAEHPLPPGRRWGQLPLTQPHRTWAVAAFVEAVEQRSSRRSGNPYVNN